MVLVIEIMVAHIITEKIMVVTLAIIKVLVVSKILAHAGLNVRSHIILICQGAMQVTHFFIFSILIRVKYQKLKETFILAKLLDLHVKKECNSTILSSWFFAIIIIINFSFYFFVKFL